MVVVSHFWTAEESMSLALVREKEMIDILSTSIQN